MLIKMYFIYIISIYGVAEMRRLFPYFKQFIVLLRFYISMITDFTPGNYNKDVAMKQV